MSKKASWPTLGVLGLLALVSGTTTRAAATNCSPRATIVESPGRDSFDVQVKGINDRGDIVGFADTDRGSGPDHAILWKHGKAAEAVDLGVLRGYVSSEAYGINNHRVVFGLLYDKKERTFPFRWENGHMKLLEGPDGRIQPTDGNPASRGYNAINERGEIAWTLMVGGKRHAVRWASNGKATFLSPLPGHTQTAAYGINDDGVVSGWSRKLPNDDGEENPVLWTKSGAVVPLKTVPGRADGIADATNHAGVTVGVLGTLGTDADPESDQFAVWRSRTAEPLLLGLRRPNVVAEFVDVNDRGEAAGGTATANPKTGFLSHVKAVIWRTGWTRVRPLVLPAASRRANPFVIPQLNDVNERGVIVGNVYGASAPDYSKIRRIDPVVWTCASFGETTARLSQTSAIATTAAATLALSSTLPTSPSSDLFPRSSRPSHPGGAKSSVRSGANSDGRNDTVTCARGIIRSQKSRCSPSWSGPCSPRRSTVVAVQRKVRRSGTSTPVLHVVGTCARRRATGGQP
jgi:probable HAF family extracellular repeat protein